MGLNFGKKPANRFRIRDVVRILGTGIRGIVKVVRGLWNAARRIGFVIRFLWNVLRIIGRFAASILNLGQGIRKMLRVTGVSL
jgi:phage-related protein